MVAEIPSDLLELVNGLVGENIEEYDIDFLNNEKGQGFIGEILLLNIIHRKTQEKQQLIVKQERKESGTDEEDFIMMVQNEMNFYETIWPFLQEYFKNASGKEVNILPKCFGTSYTGRKRIIMENITTQGFMLYDRTKPFDDDHFRKMFQTYGIFHGISLALKEQNREQYNRLASMQFDMLKKIYNEEDNTFCKSFIERYQEAQDYFDPVEEKDIQEKLHMYETYGIQLLRDCVNGDFPNGALIHGDCWSNNFMFRYNEQRKPQEVKIIDFQVVCHGTPVFDLSYCLYASASAETLANLDEYLKIYHRSLSDTLSEFGLSAENIYSFKTLKEEWKMYCKHGFTFGLHVMKMKLVDKDDMPDLSDDLCAPVKLKEELQDVYKKHVRELVIHFYNNDFF